MNTLQQKINKLHTEALNLPQEPGVYLFYNKENTIIYVGKAKNLKNRVSSYFNAHFDNYKTKILVNHILFFEHIIVETETDALLLENNLIKKYQPRYNIQLKDDKSYPWICIKKEPFPRVFQTRKLLKDGSKYYGPYTSVRLIRVLLNFFRHLFQIRTCKLDLTSQNIADKKFKVCLEYHINNCKAPCVGYQSSEKYNKSIEQIHNILKGNFSSVNSYLNNLMQEYARNLEFEKAQQIKDKLELLQKYQKKSTVLKLSGNYDVFSIISDEKNAYVNYLKIVDGAIIHVHTIELLKKLDEKDEEILAYAILEIIRNREINPSEIKEVILPFSLTLPYEHVKITLPKIGDKFKLLELSKRNAKYYRMDKIKQRNLLAGDRRTSDILKQMSKDLNMDELPQHIECFDNSNIQGTHPVAACVVFKNAKPDKKNYRKFNIKTVEGPDDFSSMEEIVYRRYAALLKEKKSLPQLIIIDGGKGQLSAAVKSLKKLDLYRKITIIGIAKRLEEIFFPEDPIPLYLDKTSRTLRVIQQARNEAHRFGITFHRKKRSNSFIKSFLEDIPGVGEKTIQNLYAQFKDMEGIKKANLHELEKVTGKSKAKKIIDYLESLEQKEEKNT